MNNLKKINAAEVISSEGFKVKIGRDMMTYIPKINGGRYVSIPIEDLGEPYELSVKIDLMSDWLERGVPVASIIDSDLELIKKRVKKVLVFLGIKHFYE